MEELKPHATNGSNTKVRPLLYKSSSTIIFPTFLIICNGLQTRRNWSSSQRKCRRQVQLQSKNSNIWSPLPLRQVKQARLISRKGERFLGFVFMPLKSCLSGNIRSNLTFLIIKRKKKSSKQKEKLSKHHFFSAAIVTRWEDSSWTEHRFGLN